MGPRLTPGTGPGARTWTIDAAVVAALTALFAVQLLTGSPLRPGQRPVDVVTVILVALMICSYLLHRRTPLTAAAVSLSLLLIGALLHIKPYPGVNVFVLLFGISVHCQDRRRRFVVFAATMAALTVSVWTQPAGVATTSTWVSTLLLATVAGLGGDNLRHRRARWATLQERARFLESDREERARRAVIEERFRIARELHDVVAHSMSVIAVQAGVGHHVLDAQPEEARRALAAIEMTSRTALTEMRRLLGVLRADGQRRAELSPAPGLADLPLLLTQVREAGLNITSTTTGDPTAAAPPVDLTAFRIVQEALTNTLKHGGPTARLSIEYRPDALYIEILDDGRPDATRTDRAPVVSGHGLVGMRERVAVFGGQLAAGSRPGGGFRLAVTLPLDQEHP